MLLYGRIFADEIRFFVELDYRRYVTDPEGIQRDLAAIFTVSSSEAIAIAAGGALSIIVMVIGFGAISAGTLDAAAGRKPTFAKAWDAVTDHLWTILGPAVILALAWTVLGVPLILNQGATMGGGARGRRSWAASSGWGARPRGPLLHPRDPLGARLPGRPRRGAQLAGGPATERLADCRRPDAGSACR